MKILSLDTAMAACSAAVIDTEAALPLAAAFVPMERGHAEALLPLVHRVIDQVEGGFGAIDRVAVTVVPAASTALTS